jgi:hypothetical protein
MISWGLRHLCVGLALLGLGITTAHADLEKTFTGAVTPACHPDEARVLG